MKQNITQDKIGTHIAWELEGVTAQMIDWFWSNMEKGFVLWHPEEHEFLEWPVPIAHGDIRGAIHNAPQTWGDGQRRDLYIKFLDIGELTPEESSLIEHEHVLIASGLGFSIEEMEANDPIGLRLHQWSKSDGGVVGKSSALPRRIKDTPEQGMVWAAHAAQEVGNWEVFLPRLFELYKVVTDTKRNPFTDLSVSGSGQKAAYRYMK